jgi:hypothetical protein
MTLAMRMKNNLGSADTGRGPSPNIWGDCPILSILEGTIPGIHLYDDFTKGGLITSPTTTAALVGLPYSGFGSSGATITYADELGGGIVIAETTDNEGVSVFSLSHCFQLGLTKGPFWFEARIKPSHTATTEQAMFLGLHDSTAKSVTVPLGAAAGAMSDANYVGFHKLETDLLGIKTVYKSDGVTGVTLETCAAALTAATYVKLGFKKDRSGLVSFYINNLKQDKEFQTLNDLGTGFPGDVLMAPCLAMILGAAANDNTITLGWWRCAQVFA